MMQQFTLDLPFATLRARPVWLRGAAFALLASVCAALPLFNHVGLLEIAAVLGVAGLGIAAVWRSAAVPPLKAPAEDASGAGANETNGDLQDLCRLLGIRRHAVGRAGSGQFGGVFLGNHRLVCKGPAYRG